MEQVQWKQLFAEQLSSGFSVREFCLSKDIKQKTFYTRRSAMGLSPHQAKPVVIKEIPSAFIKTESLTVVNRATSASSSISLTVKYSIKTYHD